MGNPFTAPFKTGFVSNVPPLKGGDTECVEYPFEWFDGNPDDEDRNGYGVSLEEGKLVVGGKSIIGVTTRVDDYDPGKQWVAMGGCINVRATHIGGNVGYIDSHGRAFTSKKVPKGSHARRVVVLEVVKEPEVTKNIFQRIKCVSEGSARVLLW